MYMGDSLMSNVTLVRIQSEKKHMPSLYFILSEDETYGIWLAL